MKLGFIMLVHTAFDRAEQVARHYADHGCPVVIHVDGKVRPAVFRAFRKRFAGDPTIVFSRRVRVEWGTWSLVRATQFAAERLMKAFPDLNHVYLTSGSCLPLRPVGDLCDYLDARPNTDFIESVTTDEVNWAVDGLEAERFTLRFPFSWRKNRRLFDRYVDLQRKLRLRRRLPTGLVPHLGSQWWCLTRKTLQAILTAPNRAEMDTYFARVWIPDESYFQSLARTVSDDIDSRSLTLSKFDVHGRPHVFYDDHLPLLERSDCFVARKIWPEADRLYETFLNKRAPIARRAEPNPGKIDRVFTRANEKRGRGRPGLYSQGRFPDVRHGKGVTAARYNVFCGFDHLFEDPEPWLRRHVGGRIHGHLYGPDRVEFSGEDSVLNGCLTDSASLRNYRPRQFLSNLLWSTRGERQSFMFCPEDRQEIAGFLAYDPNATIVSIAGAWAVPLHISNRSFEEVKAEAARMQRIELAFHRELQTHWTAARVHIWSLADFVEQPLEKLQNILDEINGPDPRRLTEVPKMRDLSGFRDFLLQLRNGGIKLKVTGDIESPAWQKPPTRRSEPRHVH